MRQYYQGQLDFFCAVYAVINALGILRPTSLHPTRDAFATILEEIADHKELLQATMRNTTDFQWLTAYSLARMMRMQGVLQFIVRQPFAAHGDCFDPQKALNLENVYLYKKNIAPKVDPQKVWDTLETWLPAQRQLAEQPGVLRTRDQDRSIVVRFHRYMMPETAPYVLHWTAADALTDTTLLLRDASREDGALHSLERKQIVFHPDDVRQNKLLLIEPESLFLLERKH